MEKYNDQIADNDKAEMIHISLDRSDEAAEKWAKNAKMPWPIMLPKKANKTSLKKFAGRGVPHYVLVDKDGNKLAEGQYQAFSKLKELTK
ncbi:hypothetical protein G3M56_013855 [Sulfuriroseicoccus oceanibius]|uniref:Uncharacterized protein n=1 Tax=Sulfuriroseicoccus oceanibius TaxID=2707525 RepID=A0A6B3LAH8_9BACT|nr:hypothetical protein G3M56_013855 [Sulfuriroseicoccus oceanibius]